MLTRYHCYLSYPQISVVSPLRQRAGGILKASGREITGQGERRSGFSWSIDVFIL